MSKPRYPTVVLYVQADEVEQLGADLFDLGATGVEQRDATTMDRSAHESAVELVAHFPDVELARAAQRLLPEGVGAQLSFVIGDDWKYRWREFFRPTRVGARFVIRPPWEEAETEPGDHVITIDPGLAFGTGTHETTRLVIAEIERLADAGAATRTVLDVGCGSGILSIAAGLLGAERLVAIDIDPIAARVAVENGIVNGATIEASTTPVQAVEGTFDLVLANIRSPILIPMAAALLERTGQHLVLSGLLLEERVEVREAFDPRFEFVHESTEGQWLALTYRRGAIPAS